MFILEGNIGSGKSTFLSLVKKNLTIEVLYEPTDQWQNVGEAGNLLDLFYNDMPRWAYTFQSYAFLSRVKMLNVVDTGTPRLAERSIYCDRFCFAKNCFERGVMTALEWQLYQEWFAWLATQCVSRPQGFIYLRTSPEVSYNRLQKRSRCEESSVALSYLQEIHQKHDDWLIHKKETIDLLVDVPVLVINGDNEFENDKEQQLMLMKQVDQFVNNTILSVNSEKRNGPKKEEFDKQASMFSY